MNEATLNKLIRQSCNEIAEQEYRELGLMGEEEHVFSRKFRRRMRRLLKYRRIDRSKKLIGQQETLDTADEELEEWEVGAAEKELELAAGSRGRISHPVHWRKRTVAVLVAILVMLFGTMVTFGAREVDSWIDELTFTYNDGFMEITQNGWTYTSPSKFVKAELSYVPEGYELYEEVMSEAAGDYIVTYVNEDEEMFSFNQMAAGLGLGRYSLPSNGMPMEDIMVNRYEGYYIPSNEGWGSIVFCDEDYLYIVCGGFKKEELLEIAKGIEVTDDK